jgi:anti-sigma B factor antagonist
VRRALLETLADAPDVLVVDLGEVTFIDSTALGVLIEARSRMDDRSGFRLAAPGLEVSRALEVSGLDRHFVVHDTVADAVGSAG